MHSATAYVRMQMLMRFIPKKMEAFHREIVLLSMSSIMK